MHSWSNPPDLCLLSTLAHIPLSELICTFGLVCKYWARLQREELNRRRTLVLVPHSYDLKKLREKPYGSDLIRHVRRDDGCPWIRYRSSEDIERDVVEILEPDKFDTYIKFYEPLLSILPNITHLTIVRYNPLYNKLHQFENTQLDPELTPFHQMTRLLTHFRQSTKLISLNIKFKVYPWLPHYNITTKQANDLIESINELKSLQHLTMNMSFRDSNPTLQLSILSRLKSFTVHNSTHLTICKLFVDSFSKYATGDVSMKSIDCRAYMTLKQMNAFDRRLAKKFIGALIDDPLNEIDYYNFRLFCLEFISLSTLQLCICHMPMSMLSRCLVQLNNLTHLDLNFYTIPLKVDSVKMTQLPTVRLLTLYIQTRSHHDTERLHLDTIFPNLQVLNLSHDSDECNECGYHINEIISVSWKIARVNGVDFTEEHRLQIEQCMRKARQPFRDCAKLHTIKLRSFANILLQGLITRDEWGKFSRL